MNVQQLPAGTKGFDCNFILTNELLKAAKDREFKFAFRYIRRSDVHSYDLYANEAARILQAGLALSTVQHVAAPGWLPTAGLGTSYGKIAADSATKAGIVTGTNVFLDLEEPSPTASKFDTIAFSNSWHERVSDAGFKPGLYVGAGVKLSSMDLYRELRFEHYWAAYNLNLDEYPAVRGVQIIQHRQVELAPGLYVDPDVIQADAKGGLPWFLVPDEWS